MTKKIAVFVGSLRKESFNRKMAKALMTLAPGSLNLGIIEIGIFPFTTRTTTMKENPFPHGSRSGRR